MPKITPRANVRKNKTPGPKSVNVTSSQPTVQTNDNSDEDNQRVYASSDGSLNGSETDLHTTHTLNVQEVKGRAEQHGDDRGNGKKHGNSSDEEDEPTYKSLPKLVVKETKRIRTDEPQEGQTEKKTRPAIEHQDTTETDKTVARLSNRRGEETTAGDHGDLQVSLTRKLEPSLVLVLDTNILLEEKGLDFMEKFAKGNFDNFLPSIVIVIPHVVFLELDRQKIGRSGDVAYKARRAVRFLEDNMGPSSSSNADNHDAKDKNKENDYSQYSKRIIGQTVNKFTEGSKEYLNQTPDDHFLICALQLQSQYKTTVVNGRTRIWPITNDRVLRTRCYVNGLNARSLDLLLENIEKKRLGRPSLI